MFAKQQITYLKRTQPSVGKNIVVHSQHPNHFHCFCYKLYFLSSFKDFNTIAPAH